MLPVIWHLNDSNWDTAFPKWVLNHAAHCQHIRGIDTAPMFRHAKTGVIVIPGQHSTADYEKIVEAGAQFPNRVVYVIIGDEEGKFDARKIVTSHAKIWWFAPPWNKREQVEVINRPAPFGWPGDNAYKIYGWKALVRERKYDVSFMGQVTHVRREQCIAAAQTLPSTISTRFHLTTGFAQGVPTEDYCKTLCESKIVLCPSGPCIPDSFRFAEALEANAVPIVDGTTPNPTYPIGYWNYLFRGPLPFPAVYEWSTLPEYVDEVLADWNRIARNCILWWKQQKERLVGEMKNDLEG